MLVQDIGEFQLIDLLAKTIEADNARFMARLEDAGFRTRLSIGDDAAAWEGPPGTRVFTTDTMVEGVHFNLSAIDWRDLGWKSLAVNLSDIGAMGCAPIYSVVTLGLRGDLPVDGLKEMYRGMMDACEAYGGAVVGGDIVRSPAFFVTVAMEGVASSGDDNREAPLLTRNSALVGDKIAVTGHLGCSGGGLRMLLEDLTFDAETASHLRDAHNHPMPRVQQGIALAKSGVVAAMDVSDGLVNDLTKICAASGAAAIVHANDVPADSFLKKAYPDDWLGLALGGGEDYELLFTAPQSVMDKVVRSLDIPIAIIGDIVEGPPRVEVVDGAGNPVSVERGGWDHFQ